MGRRKPSRCLHPAGKDRGGLLGEVAFTRCPALRITDLSRAIYEIHDISHSVQQGGYLRHIEYADIIEMPHIVKNGFDVIGDETAKILREQNARSQTGLDGSDKAQ